MEGGKGGDNMHSRRVFFLGAIALAATIAVTPAQAATTTITSTGPLTSIGISDLLNCSVVHTGGGHQFYGATACGTLLAAGGTLYGPASIPAGGGAGPRTSWTAVSQSTVSGTGTDTDPYVTTTVVDAGSSGLRVVEDDTYVVGRDSYRTTVRIENSGAAAADVVLYRAGDCYLGGSDYGYGFVVSEIGAVACSKTADNEPADRVEQWVPITGGSNYFHDSYGTVWSHIGSQAPFPDTCKCATFLDNGAGLSWSLSVPAAGAVTVSHITNFGLAASLSKVEAHAAVLDVDVTDPTAAGVLTYAATVTDAVSGAPVAGAPIEFYVGSELVCTGTTGVDGRGGCESLTTAVELVQAGEYTALFPGSTAYLASADTGGLVTVNDMDVL